ncbi:MAG: trehalose-phosphatase [Alphaproteobacteria bacterium]|nr:trehalose-phosphatase [Alphaproteobacteria bacterium]
MATREDEAMSEAARPPVPTPGTIALFLDLDASLIDVPPGTAAGVVTPERVHLLARLHDRLDGALALVSGRTVAELDDLVAPLNLTLAGVHGLDRRLDDGRRVSVEPGAALAPARAALAAFALDRAGVRFEDKGVALALHAGGEAAAAARAATERALVDAGGELALRAADGVVELLPAGHDEATALAALAAEPPFRGRRPVFVGGEEAMAGVRAAAARGGTGVVVAPTGETPAGTSALADASDLEAWLEDWLNR